MTLKKIDYKIAFEILIYSIFLAAFVYIITTQFSNLENSVKLMIHSNTKDELIAFCFVLVTFVAGSQSYLFLSFTKLKLLRTIFIEFAVTAVNRIVPSGIGALATNYVYLRKHNNTRVQSTAVVAINNILGFIANMCILGILLITVKSNPLKFRLPNERDIIIVGAVIAIFIIILLTELRKKIFIALKNFIKEVKTYRQRKDHLVFAFICAISLTFASVLALYYSLSAINVSLPFSSLMLSYSFSIWLGAILPTPGGVGAVETGLTGAFVAFGLKFDVALSAVLIFRLITFWIPFLLGGLAFVWSRKRRYI